MLWRPVQRLFTFYPEQKLTLKHIPVIFQVGLLLYLIWVCDAVTAEVRTRAANMIGKLTNGIHQLEKVDETGFSACNMFDTKRKWIVSFTTSVTTFMVLFIQIADGSIEG